MRMFLKTRNLILLLFSFLFLMPAASFAQVAIGVSIRLGPPALPVYAQPPAPGDGYLWTPGYWAYGPDGYYWVPGVWVTPPRVGVLWTPGYWGFAGGLYAWHAGYWGPHVGFYGGINYGFGYGGVGFVGGRWGGGHFLYNTAVVNVNTTVVRNVYVDRTVINNTTVVNNHTSFNGPGGIARQPTGEEQAAVPRTAFPADVQPTLARAHRRSGPESAGLGQQRAARHCGDGFGEWPPLQPAGAYRQWGGPPDQLTPGRNERTWKTAEAGVNKEIHNDRSTNGGALTPQERQQVNRQQNNLSNSIYNDKHNAATPDQYGNNQVGARRDQQAAADRQRNSQRSDCRRRRSREARGKGIPTTEHQRRMSRPDRQANGGRLTPAGKRRTSTRQQNAASKADLPRASTTTRTHPANSRIMLSAN